MYVLTYKGKPITARKLAKLEKYYNTESEMFIASRLKKDVIDKYLYYVGFTWQERTKGIEVTKVRL